MAYVHPVFGAAVTVLILYVASLGLRARADRRRARLLLEAHVRLATAVYWLCVASFVGGLLSVRWLRPELEFAGSMHMRLGVCLLLSLSGSAATARRMAVPALRAAHPWFGAAAVLVAAAQVFFGLQITP